MTNVRITATDLYGPIQAELDRTGVLIGVSRDCQLPGTWRLSGMGLHG